jgi:hypothetical protein
MRRLLVAGVAALAFIAGLHTGSDIRGDAAAISASGVGVIREPGPTIVETKVETKVKRVPVRDKARPRWRTGQYAHGPGITGNLAWYGPGCRLDRGAVESLRHIGIVLGKHIQTVSCWRSYAQQVRLHAAKPYLAAPAGSSLHERGLAIDVAAGFLARHPRVKRLLYMHGWHQFAPDYEPWHFSYRLTG